MSDTKHTPGPWTATPVSSFYDDGLEIREHCQVRIDAGDEIVAHVEGDNAALIAAAPELLTACELALRYFAGGRDERTARDLESVRAAIAKAKGGA